MSKLYSFLFSQENRAKLERLTVILAIAGFFAHLVLILAAQIWSLELFGGQLLQNPINAIYTPFSFILIFEIYLLIFYLPRSFSTSLLKQFEVISLIMVRRVFGDITNINFAEIEISAPSRFWPSNPRKPNYQTNVSYFTAYISFFGNFS